MAGTTTATTFNPTKAFPPQTWWLIGCVIGTATIINVVFMVWSFFQRRRGPIQTIVPSSRTGAISIRRLPYAILTASRITAFRFTLPVLNLNVLEGLLTAVYLSGLLIWGFSHTGGHLNSSTPSLKKWANRVGVLATSQMPLVIALAGKNNIIQWLTGIGHEKLIIMHRSTSRVVFLLVWLHALGRFLINPSGAVSKRWEVYGLVAGAIFVFMCLFSLRQVRKRFYEFFYLTHLVLVALFMVFATIHVYEPGYANWIWPAWAFWWFDRCFRYIRYTIFNFILRPKNFNAETELLGGDSVRVTVRRWIPGGWRAGQHAFLMFPTLAPLESHPFTICVAPDDTVEGRERELMFIIRARDGLTLKLLNKVIKEGNIRIPILVDGPYGCPPDLTPFSTCVLIGGGSGVAYTLPHLQELVKQVNAGNACARRIAFVWATREESHIEWIAAYLRKACADAPASLSLSVDVYVTAVTEKALPKTDEIRTASRASSDPDSNYNEKRSNVGSDYITIHYGRPDVCKILEDEITLAEGTVSVDVSGPQLLVDDVKASLATTSFANPMGVMKGMPTVQLNVESFSM